MRITALLVVSLITSSALSQRSDPAQYEKFLLPLYTSTAGANGSYWQTLLYLRNEAPRPVDAFPLSPDCVGTSTCFQTVRRSPAFTTDIVGVALRPGSIQIGDLVRDGAKH